MSHAEGLRGNPNFQGKLPSVPEKHRHTARNVFLGTIGAAVITAGITVGINLYNENSNSIRTNPNSIGDETGSPAPSQSAELPGVIIPTSTPEATPTPTVTPEPTPIATPEATPVATPEALSPIEQKMQLAPDIEGFTKQIQTINGLERVTYVDKEGNYIGEYKKEVTFEGKETGGIALIPSVAEKMLTDQLSKLPEGDQWLVPLPLDISDMKTEDNVAIYWGDGYLGSPSDVFFSIKTPEPVSVTDIVPGKNNFYSGTIPLNGYTLTATDLIQLKKNDTEMINGEEMKYLQISASYTEDPICWSKDNFSFGDKLGNGTVCDILVGGVIFNKLPSYDKIFKVADLPVFITSK